MKYFIILFLQLTIIIGGCYPDSLKYQLGFGTRSIEGTILEEGGNSPESKSFIVVVEYYSRFIKFENEPPIYVPKARLVFPDRNGNFFINFDLKASSIDLAFVSSEYSMERFFFRRQLGIGKLSYDARLVKSNAWKNEFFLQIGPYLNKFILEQRYKMPDSQQMFLGNWLANIRKEFTDKKNN